jgi:hypothetical protein
MMMMMMMMSVEQSVELLARETEVLGRNLSHAALSTTNPTCSDPGSNPGRRCGKPATNRLSYGTAALDFSSSSDEVIEFFSICLILLSAP